MLDNISTGCRANHPQPFDERDNKAGAVQELDFDIDSSAIEVKAELRNACIAARAVLCEALLVGKFDEESTAGAIKGINDALIMASFLD
jgi:hypothetical protein